MSKQQSNTTWWLLIRCPLECMSNVFWPVIVAVAESSNRDGEGLPYRVQCVLDHLCLMADGEPAIKATDTWLLKGEYIYIAHIVSVKIISDHLLLQRYKMLCMLFYLLYNHELNYTWETCQNCSFIAKTSLQSRAVKRGNSLTNWGCENIKRQCCTIQNKVPQKQWFVKRIG